MSRPHHLLVTIGVLVAGLLLSAAPALAVHPDPNTEIENLKKRIEALEAEGTAQHPDESEEPAIGRLGRQLTLHGLLEVEATFVQPDDGDTESDLTLATAELGIEATANEYVGGHLTLLYEEVEGEDDNLVVDEAVISLTAPGRLFGLTPSLHVGRMYVPFGNFNSAMISDPLTLELGETQDTAALLVLEGEIWVLKAGIFNGETDAVGDDNQIDNLVAAFELTPIENLIVGVSYINDLAESDNGLVQDAALYADNVAGASVFLSAHCTQFGLELEYLTALEEFDAALLGVGEDLTGQRPAAWNLELSWLPREHLQLAARYEQAEDFQHDVVRYGGTVSYGLDEHLVVGIEYLRADADAAGYPANLVTAQLALEF